MLRKSSSFESSSFASQDEPIFVASTVAMGSSSTVLDVGDLVISSENALLLPYSEYKKVYHRGSVYRHHNGYHIAELLCSSHSYLYTPTKCDYAVESNRIAIHSSSSSK